ncbi:MAG: hypothetical protein OEU94_03330 [Aquincola sp.]|nr:hypothetical protein [Aquincola sp.]MDH4290256.1 hypothetical protein [Aquincola sp.]
MRHLVPRFACAAILAAAACAPAHADSLASSASSASSASVGSLSDSISGSSNSGGANNKPVAAGTYRIVEVAALVQRPGHVRVKLEGSGGDVADASFYLDLPQVTFDGQRLAAGDLVDVSERTYGLAFARAQAPREAFFLVLADAWYRELDARALEL